MSRSMPKERYQGKSYIGNGKKPLFDDAACARIKKRNDEGVSLNELKQMYGVSLPTIRAAILRAEFAKAAP